MRVDDGLPTQYRDVAIRLFWDAFRGKLGAVLRPDDKALELLSSSIDPRYALSAFTSDGLLLGLAGYKTRAGAFMRIDYPRLRDVYGTLGGLWRGGLLSLLNRPIEEGALLMDGIFVDEAARGQGVGSALLSAAKEKAACLGRDRVRLDVIDTNPRARSLYERHGFVATSSVELGALRRVFGFSSAVTMLARIS